MNHHQIPHNLKGPWEVTGLSDKGLYIKVRSTCPGSHFRVANVPFTAEKDQFYAVDDARQIATCIAAAPTMLETLLEIRRYMATDSKDWGDLYLQVSGAIEKATGAVK